MRRQLGLCAVLVAAAGAMLPTTASAEAAARVVYRAPTPGQVLTVSSPTITAFVSALPGQVLTVKVTGPASATTKVTATDACQHVNVSIPLTHNGRYEVVVTTDVPVPVDTGGNCAGGSASRREFFVAAPPRAPAGVRASKDPSGPVAVSWDRNPEPDIVSYRVERAAGAGPFQQFGETRDTSFSDGSPPPGQLRYRVLAVRHGKTAQETVVSAPSAPVTVGGILGGGTVRPGSGNALFSNPTTGRPGEQTSAAAGEGGFDERLPYGPAGEEDVTELGADETSNNPRRALAFVAGGLLALVTAMQMRWLKRQSERPVSA